MTDCPSNSRCLAILGIGVCYNSIGSATAMYLDGDHIRCGHLVRKCKSVVLVLMRLPKRHTGSGCPKLATRSRRTSVRNLVVPVIHSDCFANHAMLMQYAICRATSRIQLRQKHFLIYRKLPSCSSTFLKPASFLTFTRCNTTACPANPVLLPIPAVPQISGSSLQSLPPYRQPLHSHRLQLRVRHLRLPRMAGSPKTAPNPKMEILQTPSDLRQPASLVGGETAAARR